MERTWRAKVVVITVVNSDVNADDTCEIEGLLHPDGRLYVEGAGVDGGDSLYASIDAYEPNGLDFVESIQLTNREHDLTLENLESGDRDNVRYSGKSLLTDVEREALKIRQGSPLSP